MQLPCFVHKIKKYDNSLTALQDPYLVRFHECVCLLVVSFYSADGSPPIKYHH